MDARYHCKTKEKQQQDDSCQVFALYINWNVENLKDNHSKNNCNAVNCEIPEVCDSPVAVKINTAQLLLQLFPTDTLIDYVN